MRNAGDVRSALKKLGERPTLFEVVLHLRQEAGVLDVGVVIEGELGELRRRAVRGASTGDELLAHLVDVLDGTVEVGAEARDGSRIVNGASLFGVDRAVAANWIVALGDETERVEPRVAGAAAVALNPGRPMTVRGDGRGNRLR